MNSHELQQRIQGGDRDAFRELYAVCGQGVYLNVQKALGNADEARDAVKKIFVALHHEILASGQPLDVDARLEALTAEELRARSAPEAAPAAQPMPEAPAFEAPVQQSAADMPVQQSAPEIPAQPVAAPDPFAAAEPYRPPLERAQAYMQADAEAGDTPRKKREPRKEREAKTGGSAVITVLIVIFLLLFLWVLAGILMDFHVIPRIDLGFRWFNETVFPLFNLAS